MSKMGLKTIERSASATGMPPAFRGLISVAATAAALLFALPTVAQRTKHTMTATAQNVNVVNTLTVNVGTLPPVTVNGTPTGSVSSLPPVSLSGTPTVNVTFPASRPGTA